MVTGKLFGTTSGGGINNVGIVFEITPPGPDSRSGAN